MYFSFSKKKKKDKKETTTEQTGRYIWPCSGKKG